jgi:hypothetical protein
MDEAASVLGCDSMDHPSERPAEEEATPYDAVVAAVAEDPAIACWVETTIRCCRSDSRGTAR